MKYVKKIVAIVAVLSCCFTVSRPILANAAAGCNNGNHIMKYEYMTPKETYSTHELTITSQETGETVPVTCTITTVIEVYRIICECGAVDNGTVENVIAVNHSYYDCPYAN